MSRLSSLLCRAVERRLQGGSATVPVGAGIFWDTFQRLSRARSCGPTGPNPISYVEIEAYARLMQLPLEPEHVQILTAMDRAWMEHAYRDRSAPEGVKTVPRRSEHKLTAAMFDASLG